MTPKQIQTLWRAREVASSVFVLVWAGFHVWEQWSAFAGRGAFVQRMRGTSVGGAAIGVEVVLGLLPILVWLGIELRLLTAGKEPDALRLSMAEDEALASRLGTLVRVGSWIFLTFLIVHVVWLYVPKWSEGAEPLRAWARLRGELGTWPLAIVHALGLTGFALHVWAAPTRLGAVFGWLPTAEARRASRLSGLIVAVAATLLLGQLIGWHAAGAGTIWSM